VLLVFNGLASAEAVLLPAEKELGVVLVDIGSGTTELAIYEQKNLWYASVLPVGGDHITNDLAVGLRTPIAAAEKIKREHGCVREASMPDDELHRCAQCGRYGNPPGIEKVFGRYHRTENTRDTFLDQKRNTAFRL
jgi:cell division protein FtsA